MTTRNQAFKTEDIDVEFLKVFQSRYVFDPYSPHQAVRRKTDERCLIPLTNDRSHVEE